MDAVVDPGVVAHERRVAPEETTDLVARDEPSGLAHRRHRTRKGCGRSAPKGDGPEALVLDVNPRRPAAAGAACPGAEMPPVRPLGPRRDLHVHRHRVAGPVADQPGAAQGIRPRHDPRRVHRRFLRCRERLGARQRRRASDVCAVRQLELRRAQDRLQPPRHPLDEDERVRRRRHRSVLLRGSRHEQGARVGDRVHDGSEPGRARTWRWITRRGSRCSTRG